MKKPTKSLPKKETKPPLLTREFKRIAPDEHTYIGWGTAAQFRDTPTDAEGRFREWPTDELYIRHTRMPDCCGISLLSFFHSWEHQPFKTFVTFLSQAIEVVSETTDVGGIIVTTSESVQPVTAKVLKEVGFKEVARSGNPNSGNVVSTFFYSIVDEADFKPESEHDDFYDDSF